MTKAVTTINPHDIPLQNARHEMFCRHIALGMADVDALASAGYQRDATLGTRLRERPEIIIRIQQMTALFMVERDERRRVANLQNEASELGITQRWVIDKLKENVELAMDAGQFGPAHATLKTLGIIAGVFGGGGAKDPEPPKPLFDQKSLDNFNNILAANNLFEDSDVEDADFTMDPIDEEDELHGHEAHAELDAYPDDEDDEKPYINQETE